ncbi:MAG: hypothetical protein PHN18_01810 [Sulfurospirillaceae bacterium]|nr:hypothetical protein [Sulfurospirillaceae bacterium]MDD2826527.1 hypothetical protein [Sulfurospirillaceae bacterium]
MKYLYINKEAKSNFKDWTVHGLAFLLTDSTLSQEVKAQIEAKLLSLRVVEP